MTWTSSETAKYFGRYRKLHCLLRSSGIARMNMTPGSERGAIRGQLRKGKCSTDEPVGVTYSFRARDHGTVIAISYFAAAASDKQASVRLTGVCLTLGERRSFLIFYVSRPSCIASTSRFEICRARFSAREPHDVVSPAATTAPERRSKIR